MSKKRRDDTSLSSLLGRKREINVEEIEKATQKVHKAKKEAPKKEPLNKKEPVKKAPEPVVKAKVQAKPPQRKIKEKAKALETEAANQQEEEQVVRASIATPYELYLRAKRQQRKDGFRSLGAFYLNCVEAYLQNPTGKNSNYTEPDFSDSIDVSVSPELELWTQIKLNQRKLGFKNMAGFYVFCLSKYLGK